jgi:hypothetical protein
MNAKDNLISSYVMLCYVGIHMDDPQQFHLYVDISLSEDC